MLIGVINDCLLFNDMHACFYMSNEREIKRQKLF